MAYGNIVDYEPAPIPNGYYFRDKSGARKLFTGPVAEDLKAKLDASAGMSQKLASNNAAPAASYFPGLQGQLGPGGSPAAPPVAKLDAVAAQPQPATGGQGPYFPGMAEELAARQAQTAKAQPITLGLRQDAEGNVYRYDPGAPASKGGMVERGRTISGGFERSPEYEAAMAGAAKDRRTALDLQNEANQVDTDQARQAAEEERIRLENEVIEANQRAAQTRAGVEALEQKRAEALQTYASAKEDPKQAAKDVYGGKEGIWGLLSVIGGIGSAMSGQPDRVHQLVESGIERNIQAQRAAINIKRDNADNLLQELTRQTGDQKLAEMTLKDIQRQLAANALQRKGLLSQDKKNRATYLEASAILNEKVAKNADDYRIGAEGTVTKSMQNVPGSAGRAPGYQRLSLDDSIKAADALNKLNKDAQPGAGEEMKPIPTERTEKISAMAESIDAADTIEEKLGNQSGEIDDPTSGPWDSWSLSSESKRASNELDEETLRLAKGAQAARGKSDKDAELALEDASGNGSIDARKRGAERIRTQSAQKIAVELSTLTPAQRAAALRSMSPRARELVSAQLKGGMK